MSEYGPAFIRCSVCGVLHRPAGLVDGKCKDQKWCAELVARNRVHTNGVLKVVPE